MTYKELRSMARQRGLGWRGRSVGNMHILQLRRRRNICIVVVGRVEERIARNWSVVVGGVAIGDVEARTLRGRQTTERGWRCRTIAEGIVR